jgi:two-component system chemotaxis sensor kinase CheA
MSHVALAASTALVVAMICAACGDGGGQTPIGGPYGGTAPYTGPNGGNEGTGGSAGSSGSGGSDGSGGAAGSGGSTGSDGASGFGGSSGSGGASGAGGSSGSGGASGSGGSSGSGGHDAGTPTDSGSSGAPTWTEIWTDYLSPSASTGCTGSCHYHTFDGAGTAAGTCTWLTGKGQITGSANPPLTNASSSDLSWFGGYMPKDGPSSDPAAVTAFTAWGAAGGKCP